MHHVTMRMPTHARINSTNQDGAVHVKLYIIGKSLELARSVGREEQIVVFLVRPTANGHCRAQHDPQGLELRRDSIDHHTVVRVAQIIVLEPPGQSVQSRTTKSDILGCTSWHTERDMFGIALRSQNPVDPCSRKGYLSRNKEIRTQPEFQEISRNTVVPPDSTSWRASPICSHRYCTFESATTPSAETYSSVTVVSTLEGAFDLEIICLFLGKNGECRTECGKINVATCSPSYVVNR